MYIGVVVGERGDGRGNEEEEAILHWRDIHDLRWCLTLPMARYFSF
jgi:hypothetical protein